MYRQARGGGPTPNVAAAAVSRMISFEPVSTSKFAGCPLIRTGMIILFNMMLGEVVPGGVGAGLYGMLMLAVLTVFIGGLMVGRTPEYIGKKIQSFEMKMTAIVILITPFLVLVGTAIAVTAGQGKLVREVINATYSAFESGLHDALYVSAGLVAGAGVLTAITITVASDRAHATDAGVSS